MLRPISNDLAAIFALLHLSYSGASPRYDSELITYGPRSHLNTMSTSNAEEVSSASPIITTQATSMTQHCEK
jgi:hypothetical protein